MAKFNTGKGLPNTNREKSIEMHQPKQCVRVCILRNGNTHFDGVCLTVSSSFYPSKNVMLEAFTDALWPHVELRSAITHLFRTDGSPLSSMNDFKNGDIIICCCRYEPFLNVGYKVNRTYLRMLGQILHRQTKPKGSPLPKDLPQSISLFIDVGKPISQTKHTILYKGQGRAKSDRNYLIKMVDKKLVEAMTSNVYQEIQIIRQLQGHANIAELIYTVEQLKYAYIVNQCLDSDVSQLMSQCGPFPESLARQIVRDITSGLMHLHRLQVIHRDIRPENMLVKLRSGSVGVYPDIVVVKISGFDLATYYSGKKIYQCCGSQCWMAPEFVAHSGYDFGIDIWGLGVTLCYMICNEYPFGNAATTSDEIFSSTLTRRPYIPWAIKSQLSTQIRECINGMLNKNPALRLTAADIARHPFLHNA